MALHGRWLGMCVLAMAVACTGAEDVPANYPTDQAKNGPVLQPSAPPHDEPPVAHVPPAPPAASTEGNDAYAGHSKDEAKTAQAADDLGTNAPRRGGARHDARAPSSTRAKLAPKARPAMEAAGLSVSGFGVGGGGLGAAIASPPAPIEESREAYARVHDASFMSVSADPLSTFSIDVDTASYSNVRRFLRDGRLPPEDAVRVEELINYFDYDYGQPTGNEPLAVHAEVSDCPWNAGHRLVHIGLQGKVEQGDTKARNLVFLLDVSGSMEDADKLPLLKRGLTMLARNLREQDTISIVVYAGASGLVLPTTRGDQHERVLAALERLSAGGSTHGAAGIELAYEQAMRSFVPGGINRVILATDGDFNVGPSSEGELSRLIEEKRRSGVFLTVLGFGTGNLQDARMEKLADEGNGNYAYIDSEQEAHKVLVREAGATLITIAKDVKLQVEWNPKHVESYRLIGYENRTLAARDFNDDKKDAGEIGAGHSVTALYEIVPARANPTPAVDPLRYQTDRQASVTPDLERELFSVKVRYKAPNAEQSQLRRYAIDDHHVALAKTSDAFRWSAAVAGFGMWLRNSPHKGTASLPMISELARSALARDPHGEKHELLELMDRAGALKRGS